MGQDEHRASCGERKETSNDHGDGSGDREARAGGQTNNLCVDRDSVSIISSSEDHRAAGARTRGSDVEMNPQGDGGDEGWPPTSSEQYSKDPVQTAGEANGGVAPEQPRAGKRSRSARPKSAARTSKTGRDPPPSPPLSPSSSQTGRGKGRAEIGLAGVSHDQAPGEEETAARSNGIEGGEESGLLASSASAASSLSLGAFSDSYFSPTSRERIEEVEPISGDVDPGEARETRAGNSGTGPPRLDL